MKHIALFFLIIAPLLAAAQHIQQQGVVSAGGDVEGTTGTMSYSTGLTGFEYYTSQDFSMQFGLQQAVVAFPPDEDQVPEDYFIGDLTIPGGESECFDAQRTITTAGDGTMFVVQAHASAELIAGESIIMRPGTHFEQGSYVHAHITTDGSFCAEPEKHFLAVEKQPDIEDPLEEATRVWDAQDPRSAFFRVYPNPTRDRFTLELHHYTSDALILVEIYGMRGELVKRKQLQGDQPHTFSLEDQQHGIYLIRVMQGDKVGTERIIKRQ